MAGRGRELQIAGLTLRLNSSRRPGCRSLTYFEIRHDGRWLHCGDPLHGETSSAKAREALVHYARVAIRRASEAPPQSG